MKRPSQNNRYKIFRLLELSLIICVLIYREESPLSFSLNEPIDVTPVIAIMNLLQASQVTRCRDKQQVNVSSFV